MRQTRYCPQSVDLKRPASIQQTSSSRLFRRACAERHADLRTTVDGHPELDVIRQVGGERKPRASPPGARDPPIPIPASVVQMMMESPQTHPVASNVPTRSVMPWTTVRRGMNTVTEDGRKPRQTVLASLVATSGHSDLADGVWRRFAAVKRC